LQEQRQILDASCGDKLEWSHLATNCFLKLAIEGNIQGRIGVKGRGGIRRKQLIDDNTKGKRYSNLEEKVLDRTHWKTQFGGGQTNE
jgi:hypothetical protein